MNATTVLSVKRRLALRTTITQTGCFEWQGTLHRDGYGKMTVRIDGKDTTQSAHRMAYIVYVGDIPDGMMVCHHCDNRRCVNVHHLFIGTAKDNTADMIAKDRHWKGARTSPRGEKSGKAKLTEEAVRVIKSTPPRHGRLAALARRFGVTETAIRHVLIGRTWSHISPNR